MYNAKKRDNQSAEQTKCTAKSMAVKSNGALRRFLLSQCTQYDELNPLKLSPLAKYHQPDILQVHTQVLRKQTHRGYCTACQERKQKVCTFKKRVFQELLRGKKEIGWGQGEIKHAPSSFLRTQKKKKRESPTNCSQVLRHFRHSCQKGRHLAQIK